MYSFVRYFIIYFQKEQRGRLLRKRICGIWSKIHTRIYSWNRLKGISSTRFLLPGITIYTEKHTVFKIISMIYFIDTITLISVPAESENV
jgi:hypothetical protein